MLSLHTHLFTPSTDPGAPTLLLLHGTGGDERSLLPLARRVLPNANVLSPRGNVSEHGANRFFRRLAEGVFDLPDLHRRADELAAFLRAALDHYGVAGRPVHALGYSNGANIAGALLLKHPGLLASAVLLRPMVPFVPDAPVTLPGTPVLLTFGAHDPITPPDHATRYPELLTRSGSGVTSHVLPAGHELTTEDLSLAQTFVSSLTSV